MRLLVLCLLVACDPIRPPKGDRTVLLEVERPPGVTTHHHRRPNECGPCVRDQRPGESIATCAYVYDDDTYRILGYGPDTHHHWNVLACSYEAP